MAIMPNQSNVRAPRAIGKNRAAASRALQLFEPPTDAVYTIEATAHLVDMSRRTILVYCKHGLVSPAMEPADSGYYFDSNGIRALRRIDALRTLCGDDLIGIKMILDLMNEVERLHSEVRSLTRNNAPRRTKLKSNRWRN